MLTHKDYIKRKREELETVNGKITELENFAKTLEGDNKMLVEREISALKNDRQDVDGRLDQLQNETGDWRQLSEGLDQAFDLFKNRLKKAWDSFTG